jgi:aldehyde dehydrogenase (NAD+)
MGCCMYEHPAKTAFVDSEDLLNRFTGELSFGGGAVNQVNVHLFVLTMPFGGVGADGMGHYYAKYGFDALTPAKSVLIAPPDVAIEHPFPPYSAERNAELKLCFEYSVGSAERAGETLPWAQPLPMTNGI